METENRARLKRKSRNSTQRKRKNERSVIGRAKLDLIRASLEVAVRNGSLAIETVPLLSAPNLFRDLRTLLGGELLDNLDGKRREIMERWQKTARQTKQVAYRISAPFLDRSIEINAESDYHADDADQWVQVERDVLRNDTVNRLYKLAMLRIKAEYNVETRELRNARLVEFVEHASTVDEEVLSRLTRRGAVAWKDVPSATRWVDDLRGDKQ